MFVSLDKCDYRGTHLESFPDKSRTNPAVMTKYKCNYSPIGERENFSNFPKHYGIEWGEQMGSFSHPNYRLCNHKRNFPDSHQRLFISKFLSSVVPDVSHIQLIRQGRTLNLIHVMAQSHPINPNVWNVFQLGAVNRQWSRSLHLSSFYFGCCCLLWITSGLCHVQHLIIFWFN